MRRYLTIAGRAINWHEQWLQMGYSRGSKMASTTTLLRFAGIATFTFLAASPALAGVVSTPAPLLGAGIPALAAFGAGYWAIRRRRG